MFWYIAGAIAVLIFVGCITDKSLTAESVKEIILGGVIILLIAFGLRNCGEWDFMLKQSCMSSLTTYECAYVVQLCKSAKERGYVKSAKECVKRFPDY